MASYKGLKAILKHFLDLIEPVATIKEYAGTTTPEWHLFCLGQLLLISKYPKLYTELGGASSPWLCGDEPAGYFRAPDLRECVIVGVGKNTTLIFDNTEYDPATGTSGTQDHDVYTLGEFKDDQMQDHTHLPNGLTGGRIHDGRDVGSQPCEDNLSNRDTGLISVGRSGTTTHGKQVGLNYIIKY
jgi:hypothetical protein